MKEKAEKPCLIILPNYLDVYSIITLFPFTSNWTLFKPNCCSCGDTTLILDKKISSTISKDFKIFSASPLIVISDISA